MKFNLNNPRTLAITAVMTALVLGMTRIVISSTAIGGYVHLGDIAINFAALAFGPWTGLIAGGIGTALADITAGFPQFAVLSLIAHGLQGLVVGWIYWTKRSPATMIGAVIAGAIVVIAGYFLGEVLILRYSPAQAMLEVPANAIQELSGALGILVYLAVARAYPRLSRAD